MLGMSVSSLPLSSRLLHRISPTPAFLLLSLSQSIRFPMSSTIIDSFFLPSLRHKGGSLVAIGFLYGACASPAHHCSRNCLTETADATDVALASACLASLAKGPEEIEWMHSPFSAYEAHSPSSRPPHSARTGVAPALGSFGVLVSAPYMARALPLMGYYR
jgi:hypothetical protein